MVKYNHRISSLNGESEDKTMPQKPVPTKTITIASQLVWLNKDRDPSRGFTVDMDVDQINPPKGSNIVLEGTAHEILWMTLVQGNQDFLCIALDVDDIRRFPCSIDRSHDFLTITLDEEVNLIIPEVEAN